MQSLTKNMNDLQALVLKMVTDDASAVETEVTHAVETEVASTVETKVVSNWEDLAKVEDAPLITETEVKTTVYNWSDEMDEAEAETEAEAEAKAKAEVEAKAKAEEENRSWVFAAQKGSLVTPSALPAASPAKSNNSRLHLTPVFLVPDLKGGQNIVPFLEDLTYSFTNGAKGNKSKLPKNCELCETNQKDLYVVCKNGSLNAETGWTTSMPRYLEEKTMRVVTSLNDSNTHDLLFVHVDETRKKKQYCVFTFQRRFTTPNRHSNSRTPAALSEYF